MRYPMFLRAPDNGAGGAETGQEGQDTPWHASIEDESLRTAVSGFETRDKALEAMGYSAPDWRETIQDEKLRDHAGRFASVTDLVKGNIEQREKLSSAITIPSKDAKDEEVAAFHKALGAMNKVEDYEALFPAPPEGQELPEPEAAAQKVWASRFHQYGLPKATAEALLQAFVEDKAKGAEAMAAEDQRFHDEGMARLKQEWGGEFERNKDIGVETMKSLLGDDLDAMKALTTKDDRLILDHWAMIKAFAKVGREMQEGTMGAMDQTARETLDEQILDKQKQIDEAQQAGDSKRANRLYTEKQELITKRDGNRPIVGAVGRAA